MPDDRLPDGMTLARYRELWLAGRSLRDPAAWRRYIELKVQRLTEHQD